MNFNHPCKLEKDSDGDYLITFRGIPEIISQGSDYDDALSMASDALSEFLSGCIVDKIDFPEPLERLDDEVMIAADLQTSLKCAIIASMRDNGITAAELGRKLSMDYKGVSLLLKPSHTTRTPILEQALSVLGKRILVTTDDKAA